MKQNPDGSRTPEKALLIPVEHSSYWLCFVGNARIAITDEDKNRIETAIETGHAKYVVVTDISGAPHTLVTTQITMLAYSSPESRRQQVILENEAAYEQHQLTLEARDIIEEKVVALKEAERMSERRILGLLN